MDSRGLSRIQKSKVCQFTKDCAAFGPHLQTLLFGNSGRNKSGDGYYGFVSDLRHGEDDILPYHKQIDVMVTNGFALWDVVQSCHRPGSLDADIQDEIPNDIYGFCQEHPTIERIVFSNGGTGCKIFNKHFRDWWKSGQLIASTRNEESVKNFKSMTKLAQKEKDKKDATTTPIIK